MIFYMNYSRDIVFNRDPTRVTQGSTVNFIVPDPRSLPDDPRSGIGIFLKYFLTQFECLSESSGFLSSS